MTQEVTKIWNLLSLLTANDNDLIPIVDIDGGYNGRPRTKTITVGNLLKNFTSVIAILSQGQEIESLSTSVSLDANGYAQQAIALGSIYALTKMMSTVSSLRVRLYVSQEKATADLSRAIAGALPASHGLIYDAVLPSGTLSLDILPCAFAAPNQNTILVVNNLVGAIVSPTITFQYLPII